MSEILYPLVSAAQSFTDTQKAQVRANIGAAETSTLTSETNNRLNATYSAPIHITTAAGVQAFSHDASGVSAGQYGSYTAQAPVFNGTFHVPAFTVDSLGHVTYASSVEVSIPPLPVSSVNGKLGNVVLEKADVGLGNVDNVSDANKPVSIATQAALDLKANQSSISNVDNTSDANKPVSTATQTALDLKANKLTTVNNSTDTAYTFLASDANTCHIVNTSAATTRTVPSDTTAPDIAIGDSIEVQNIGTGVVTFVAASGVTIRSSLTLVMYGQYSVCMLRKIAANTWILTGERTAI